MSTTDRLRALDEALGDIRVVERLLADPLGSAVWRGPARDGFDRAGQELPMLLSTAAAAIERERERSMRFRSEPATWQGPTS